MSRKEARAVQAGDFRSTKERRLRLEWKLFQEVALAAAEEKKRKEMNLWRSLLTGAVWFYPLLFGAFHADAQIIASMDPSLGAQGEQIILTGSGFAQGAKVTF